MLKEKIGVAAMLEQTAEEAAEFAQACLKMARAIRGENPVYKDRVQLNDNLYEETADVLICIEELDPDLEELTRWKSKKKKRMCKRMKELEGK